MLYDTKPSILAIDTSTDVCSVALAHAGVIIESTIIASREHTERILPMVESILLEANLGLNDLDAIAVGIGPGSFTGLRIGLSITQGLAYGADLPIIPISTLSAMAQRVTRTVKGLSNNSFIVPAIDARMNEIYWSAYKVVNNNSFESLTIEHVSKPEECVHFCNNLEEIKVLQAVGTGWRYAENINISLFDPIIDEVFYATAYDLAELSLDAFKAGAFISALDVQPKYLRNEISWQKRQRIR